MSRGGAESGYGSAQWMALSREAGIASDSISNGLTSLRKANYAAVGLYSHAFFGLSIGFERLLKLIYLLDHSIQNDGEFPTDDQLRKRFGHDLEKLFDHAWGVHQRLPAPEKRYPFAKGGIETEIVSFLAKFAILTRYYNLDSLVGGRAATHTDPIKEWFETIGGQVLQKHYSERRKTQDADRAELMEKLIGPYALVRHTSEEGKFLGSVETSILQSSKVAIVQKYGTFYTVKIARFLYMILYELTHEAHAAGLNFPYLYEFFFPFTNDDSYLLSRKTFPPRGR